MTKQTSKVYNQVSTQVTSDIYLVGEIGAPDQYLEELQTIREAKDGEEISIYINSVGGRVDTAIQWVNAIRNSRATIVCIIEGLCHSAATYIFLSADQWIVNHNCLMLIHNYSGGSYGKGQELIQHVNANHEWVTKIMEDIYQGFLTPDEIERVKDNNDVWLTTAQIDERLQKVVVLREELAEKFKQETQEELRKKLKELNHEQSTTDSSGISKSTEE